MTALASVQQASDATVPGSLVAAAVAAVVIVVLAVTVPDLYRRWRAAWDVIRGAEHLLHDGQPCDCEATR